MIALSLVGDEIIGPVPGSDIHFYGTEIQTGTGLPAVVTVDHIKVPHRETVAEIPRPRPPLPDNPAPARKKRQQRAKRPRLRQ